AGMAHRIGKVLARQSKIRIFERRTGSLEQRGDIARRAHDRLELVAQRWPDLCKLLIELFSLLTIDELRLDLAPAGTADLPPEMRRKLAFGKSRRLQLRRPDSPQHLFLQPRHCERRHRDLLAVKGCLPPLRRHHLEMMADEMLALARRRARTGDGHAETRQDEHPRQTCDCVAIAASEPWRLSDHLVFE